MEYGYSKNDKIGDILLEPEPGYNVGFKCSRDVSFYPFFFVFFFPFFEL